MQLTMEALIGGNRVGKITSPHGDKSASEYFVRVDNHEK